jgi:hypothetical protein
LIPQPATPAPALFAEEKVAPLSASSADLRPLWDQVVEAVSRVSPFTRSYLLEAHPVSFQNGVFIIGYDPEFSHHLSLVDNSKNHALLQTKFKELGQGDVRVKFIESAEPEGWQRRPVAVLTPEPTRAAAVPNAGAAAAKGDDKKPKASVEPVRIEDFKNDPLIKKALEIFKGQIVDVRA